MRKYWHGEKKHIDQSIAATKRVALERLHHFMVIGDEEGYVALTKELNPEITPAELVHAIELFREFRRISASGA
jgi:hypothetical protein